MLITSSSNERIKELARLVKSAKERKKEGCYIVEGIRMFREIPREDICGIYVTQECLEKYITEIEEYDIEPVILTDKLYAHISDTETPQGIMAVVRQKRFTLEMLVEPDNAFLYIADRLQDPGNMGTIIRTAEAAGATGVIISRYSVDVYNSKVVRSTMGSIFRMPIYLSDDLVEDIEFLKDNNVAVYGAHLDGVNLYANDYTGKCAFLIGNEGKGLSKEASASADKLLRIPMKGSVESLNAAASATVIGYEVLRQREYSTKID